MSHQATVSATLIHGDQQQARLKQVYQAHLMSGADKLIVFDALDIHLRGNSKTLVEACHPLIGLAYVNGSVYAGLTGEFRVTSFSGSNLEGTQEAR